MIGKIVSLNAGVYKILLCDNNICYAKARGIFRKKEKEVDQVYNPNQKRFNKVNELSPKVGDNVEVEKFDETYSITKIYERKNSLIRPNVANVDQMVLIISAKEPDFSFYLLDLFITNLEKSDVPLMIIVTKVDLLKENELEELKNKLAYYENLGYSVHYINSLSESRREDFIHLFTGKVSILQGQTGAGKSSFINNVLHLNLETQEISNALNRGKHTTRIIDLYPVKNGLVGDTPGFSKLELEIEKDDVKYCFKEFLTYTCKFKNCNHLPNTKGCQIIEHLDTDILRTRYDNYLKIYNSLD